MEIGREYKLEKCVGDDDNRPSQMHINIKNGMAVATNACVIAYVPVEMVEGDTEGLLSVDALLLARKDAKEAKSDFAVITLGELQTLENGITIPRPECDPYPNVDSITVNAQADIEYRISFNPRYLMDLANAIGSPFGVVLNVRASDKPIYVTPSDVSNKAYGVLMPRLITPEEEEER